MKNSFKILDRYIIRKFLGTFFFSLALIILIAVVFDMSEKLDDFIERKAPTKAIIFDYYLNFIPYFANLFAPLFVFISVIYFTARMAMDTEIIAILNSGVSFRRLLRPYLIASLALTALSFYLNGWLIPHSNKVKLAFENLYIKDPVKFEYRNIHRQIMPGVFIYFESFDNNSNIGYRFSLEKIEKGKRTFFLNSERMLWDSTTSKWRIENYYTRKITDDKEILSSGFRLDTVLPITPANFKRRATAIQAMDTPALSEFINQERMEGSGYISTYLVEKYRRTAIPFATIVLTIIGVSLSSRKVRGGIGARLGAGIGLSFIYILFMQISNTFAINGSLSPLIAVWIPNVFFSGVALFLLKKSPK
jgi:lipopolysaccharide export system permease protein